MLSTLLGRKVLVEPLAAGPASAAGVLPVKKDSGQKSGGQKSSISWSLIVMLAAFALAMIVARAPQSGFGGIASFLNGLVGFLDSTLVGWIGRPATVGLFFALGLAGGAALWPWRKPRAIAAPDAAEPAEAASPLVAKPVATASELPVAAPALQADDRPTPQAEPVSKRLAALRARIGSDDARVSAAFDNFGAGAEAAVGQLAGEPHGAPQPQDADWQDTGDAGIEDVAGSEAPASPATTITIDPAVLASWHQAIVFREQFPPESNASLSFYGGAPVVPAGFVWPTGMNGTPLHFLLQVDCRAIPAEARLDSLPGDAVLHFFLDLEWGGPAGYRVFCHADPDETWHEAQVPADLPPVYGEDARHAWSWVDPRGMPGDAALPRLLPHWAFDPVAIHLPEFEHDADDGEDDDIAAGCWWRDNDLVREALANAQGAPVRQAQPPVVDDDGALARPFPEFPHDWRAIAITSALVIENVRGTAFEQACKRHGLDDAATEALREQYLAEAGECHAWSESHSPFKRTPRDASDMFWEWFAGLKGVASLIMREAAVQSVEATLAGSPGSARRLGVEALALIEARHALALELDTGVFAPTPNRMLAPASFVQGALAELEEPELLLLEVSSGDPIGHRFGEGVFQFTILPADLRARRFDNVRLTISAY